MSTFLFYHIQIKQKWKNKRNSPRNDQVDSESFMFFNLIKVKFYRDGGAGWDEKNKQLLCKATLLYFILIRKCFGGWHFARKMRAVWWSVVGKFDSFSQTDDGNLNNKRDLLLLVLLSVACGESGAPIRIFSIKPSEKKHEINLRVNCFILIFTKYPNLHYYLL